MKAFNKLIVMFASSNDEDLAAEENFRISFSNVVNFLLLVYSLISGLHALMIENIVMAVSNMAFSLIFILYFLSLYLTKHNLIVTAADRMVIFIHFIVSYINGSMLGSAGIATMIYPFIAIILHGRRFGVALSIIQVAICFLYTTMCKSGIITMPFLYTSMELFVLVSVQTVCIFVYYVAIRWLSSLIYDHITEVGQLNESLGIKTEMINTVTEQLKSQLTDVYNMTNNLSHERMNPRQMEIVSTLKAAAANLLDSVDVIASASEQNTRPIEREEVDINVFNLISNVLVLYGGNNNEAKNIHSVKVAAAVPQNVLGNSQLTRQIFLTSFDALDRKFDLSKTPLSVSVSMNDITSEKMMLNFVIASDKSIELDKRDLSSSESKLLYQLQLDATQRLVQAAEGEFYVEVTEDDSLIIDFTLPFKDSIRKNTEEIDQNAPIDITALTQSVKLEEARILLLEDDLDVCEAIKDAVEGKVKSISVVENERAAIKKFENSHYDIIIADVDTIEVGGLSFIRKARDMESGYGAGTPIFALSSDEGNNLIRNTSIKIDGVISKPIQPQKILDCIRSVIDYDKL